MKKLVALTAGVLMALPAVASAQIIGECSACHTMHNSEQGAAVAQIGNTGEANTAGIQNLLKLDCVGCHAMGVDSAATELLGESSVPQVLHAGGTLDGLAGGNFRFGMAAEGSEANRNVHNVKDFAWGYAIDQVGTNPLSGPPGLYGQDTTHAGRWSVETPFDEFTCAGARGCHGTRSQLLTGHTADNPDAEFADPDGVYLGIMRTGISAVTGAHHLNTAGAKQDAGYTAATVHDGATVAAGYRFIPGLWGYEVADWVNTDTSHNEYYGIEAGLGNGCGTCHIETSVPEAPAADYNYGMGTRMALDSTLKTPNNSMSGFCSTCHGNFHSSGAAGDDALATWTDVDGDGYTETFSGEKLTDGDYVKNGVSGAFLRHPSDYTIPNRGEYAAYTSYDVSAPVARTSVLTAPDAVVRPGSDLVMCLSCHVPHGSEFDYLLRFDYSADGNVMDAGIYADQAAAQAAGGCLACHSAKGVAN